MTNCGKNWDKLELGEETRGEPGRKRRANDDDYI
jgi:hypothetical protein